MNIDDIYIAVNITFDKNKKLWDTPPQLAQCDSCGKENTLRIALDHAAFFANA